VLNRLTPDDLIGSKSDFGSGLGGLPLEPAITGAEKATAVAVTVSAIKNLFMANAPVIVEKTLLKLVQNCKTIVYF